MGTFHSAIEKKNVYTGDRLTQTVSNCIFHDQCGKLRDQLIKLSKSLGHKNAMKSFKAFVEHMAEVWTAVTQNDDLVLIQNLAHIEDHRNLTEAMNSFRKIMSKTDGDNNQVTEENPLLRENVSIPENLKQYKTIAPSERLYAILDSYIQDAVREQDNKKTVQGLKNLENSTLDKIKNEVEVWWKPNVKGGLAYQMATEFTKDMSKYLKELGNFYAKTYIEQIGKKAIRNF